MNAEMFQEIVHKLAMARDNKGQPLNLHGLLIKEQGKKEVYLHHYQNSNQRSDVRSLSKTILTLVFGRVMVLAQAGDYPPINEESYIYPIIKNHVQITNSTNEKRLKKIKIKHLLTHTAGYEDVLLMRDDIKDRDPYTYLDYIVNYPLVHEPGTHYLYSNASFYLLSVVLEEFVGEDFTSFLTREFFQPLGIQKFEWERYGKYLAGATRLWLFPEDLLKIGELFLNHGQVNGQVFIAKDWLEKMIQPQIATEYLDQPEWVFRRAAYGYGIWLAPTGFYFGHGTDGQRFIILPDEKIIIIVLAEQSDSRPLDERLNQLITQLSTEE